jgi:hypothetical protein
LTGPTIFWIQVQKTAFKNSNQTCSKVFIVVNDISSEKDF